MVNQVDMDILYNFIIVIPFPLLSDYLTTFGLCIRKVRATSKCSGAFQRNAFNTAQRRAVERAESAPPAYRFVSEYGRSSPDSPAFLIRPSNVCYKSEWEILRFESREVCLYLKLKQRCFMNSP